MAAWHQIDSLTQDDLITWYNIRDVDARDKRLLARLYTKGQFLAYDCAHCGERVRQGQPEDWRDFQGCHTDEGMGELCGDCYSLYETLKQYAG
jgi:hypothetical protein